MNYQICLPLLLLLGFSAAFQQGPLLSPYPTHPGGQSMSLSSLVKLSESFLHRQEQVGRNPSSILVVGGTEAEPHQFPFQVSLQVRNYFGGYDHNCGGVIYDALHILTVAHCVRGYHQNNLRIVAGEHELFHDVGPEQYRDILGYVFHPGFEPRSLDNDIAIITLDHPLDLNENIQPLRIPTKVVNYSDTARTSGWGSDGTEEPVLKLLYVDLHVFSHAECSDLWNGTVSNGMVCAGDNTGAGGKGSCNGDSGGPLVCKDDAGQDYLCGLVSWGPYLCGLPNHPTVFTSMNAYLDWLGALLPAQENIKKLQH